MSGDSDEAESSRRSDRSFAPIREDVGRHCTRANCPRAIGGAAGFGILTHRIAALVRAEQVDVEHFCGMGRLLRALLVSI